MWTLFYMVKRQTLQNILITFRWDLNLFHASSSYGGANRGFWSSMSSSLMHEATLHWTFRGSTLLWSLVHDDMVNLAPAAIWLSKPSSLINLGWPALEWGQLSSCHGSQQPANVRNECEAGWGWASELTTLCLVKSCQGLKKQNMSSGTKEAAYDQSWSVVHLGELRAPLPSKEFRACYWRQIKTDKSVRVEYFSAEVK